MLYHVCLTKLDSNDRNSSPEKGNLKMKKISLALLLVGLGGCAFNLGDQAENHPEVPKSADDLMIVDCLLPGKVQQLGQSSRFMTARQPVKSTVSECSIRGGEYTAFDRADYATSLKIWLPQAQSGDAEAQAYVGEIYEKGMGLDPDYDLAAVWYKRSAEQGLTRAQINLGNLYEKGLGVEKNAITALNWYRKASGIDSDKLEYASTIIATQELEASLGTLKKEVADLKGYKQKNEVAMQKNREALRKESKQQKAPLVANFEPPTIEIIDPPISLTRGRPTALLRSAVSEREIIGKVKAPAGVSQFVVNGETVKLDEFNLFFLNVPIKSKQTHISMNAMDRAEQTVGFDFTLFLDLVDSSLASTTQSSSFSATNISSDKYGKFYALVIGNNEYANYANLKTAVADATEVAKLLSEQYGFDARLLLNANRYDILSAINDLRSSLTEKDNLLIYYAGHGDLDVENEKGFWLPVDAEPGNSANWLSNTSISDQLNTMKANHVMVVADSCYAGTLSTASVARQNLNLSDEDISSWLDVMTDVKARTVLTSGGVRPVLDSGGGNHSVFAKAFVKALKNNNRVIDGNSLFVSILGDVRRDSLAMAHEQIPDYGAIKYSGHEAGEFFFFPQVN
tara:strand:+ start:3787 stop:5664 length:1878 start_codon:yes stop_codon:yes gene_type:complete